MKIYRVLETKEFEVNYRKKTYKKDEIVYENVYTRAFKNDFKEIGQELGYNKNLAKPNYVENESKTIEKPRDVIIVEVKEIEELEEDIEKYEVDFVTK